MDPLDKIYTANEAAERLRLTNRGVIKLARQYGRCSRRGRDYLFSEADILALWEVMREPATSQKAVSVAAPSFGDWVKQNRWRFPPSVAVDCREMEVLRALASSKKPVTHKQIQRAGPRTVARFIDHGLAVEVGRDGEDNSLISITEKGRDQISIVDRWIKLRLKHGQSPGGWARHLKEKR